MKKFITSLFLIVGLLWLAGPLMHIAENMGGGNGVCATHCVQEVVMLPAAGVPAPLQLLWLGLVVAVTSSLFHLAQKHFAHGYASRPRPAPDIITLYCRFLI